MTSLRPWIAAALAACLTLVVALSVALSVTLAPAQNGVERAIDRGLDATLVVRTPDGAGFLGSAFLWQDGTLAVTNAHILKGHAEVQLDTRDGQQILAQVTATDAERDIAVLSLPTAPAPGLTAAPIPTLGQPVIALGAPLQSTFTATRGILSAQRQVLPAVPVQFLQHDAAINPGSSGGPLIDTQGNVVGINTRIADGSRYYIGISYALPADLITPMVAGTLPPVVPLGLALRPLTDPLAQALGTEATGLLIDDVTPGGTADAGGLRAGDILTTAGSAPLRQPGDLSMALARATGSLPLGLVRDGAPVEITVDLPDPGPPPATTARNAPPATPDTRTTLAALGVTLKGARVIALDDSGAAYAAGLATGDVIEAIGPDPFATTDLTLPALLRIRRGETTTHILIDPTRRTLRPLGGGNALDPDVTLF